MESIEIMAEWANKGFDAALRAAAKKKPKSKTRKKKKILISAYSKKE